MSAVADDRAELPSAGIFEPAIDHCLMVGSIVAEIRGDRSGAEIDMIAYDGITYVT